MTVVIASPKLPLSFAGGVWRWDDHVIFNPLAQYWSVEQGLDDPALKQVLAIIYTDTGGDAFDLKQLAPYCEQLLPIAQYAFGTRDVYHHIMWRYIRAYPGEMGDMYLLDRLLMDDVAARHVPRGEYSLTAERTVVRQAQWEYPRNLLGSLKQLSLFPRVPHELPTDEESGHDSPVVFHREGDLVEWENIPEPGQEHYNHICGVMNVFNRILLAGFVTSLASVLRGNQICAFDKQAVKADVRHLLRLLFSTVEERKEYLATQKHLFPTGSIVHAIRWERIAQQQFGAE